MSKPEAILHRTQAKFCAINGQAVNPPHPYCSSPESLTQKRYSLKKKLRLASDTHTRKRLELNKHIILGRTKRRCLEVGEKGVGVGKFSDASGKLLSPPGPLQQRSSHCFPDYLVLVLLLKRKKKK